MINAPYINEFQLVIDSQSGVRPTANYGASFTPGNNTYGAYASVLAGASLTDDAYGIWINVNSVGVSATATSTLATIGIDPAGGTSFTDLIPHLLVSMASVYANANPSGGVWYYFPLFIKAGTSLGVKGTQNNAAPVAARCFVRLLCKPSRPELLRVGSYVRTFGEATATSGGTAVTLGTTSDGAWTQLGSAIAAGDRLWFWQVAYGADTNTFAASSMLHLDLGIGASSSVLRTPILDVPIFAATTEMMCAIYNGACANAVAGDLIFGRAQDSAAAQANSQMLAYAVGG